MKKIGLYIHIPFCKSKCAYCNFTSFRCEQNKMDDYLDALNREIHMVLSQDIIIDTLYIGGGTPSILHPNDIARIVDSVRYSATYNPREVTIECNPESLDLEKIRAYKTIGINRISMGVQSINDEVLKTIGRIHTSDQAIEVAKLVKEHDLNLSVDMILGLPRSTKEDIRRFIEVYSNIGVDHISAYSLSVEDGTILDRMVKDGKVIIPTEDEAIEQYDLAYEMLNALGYHRYEVSNFARSGYESQHNSKYWRMDEYIGVGLASHSFFNGYRYYNTSNIDEYIDKISKNEKAGILDEMLTRDDLIEETIMLGLRTERGVDIKMLDSILGKSFLREYSDRLSSVRDYINIGDRYISIKSEYMNVMNSIIIKIIA